MSDEQLVWSVELVVRATADEVGAIVERIGEVVCVPPDHPDRCVTPWVISTAPADDHDEPKRSELLALLEDDE